MGRHVRLAVVGLLFALAALAAGCGPPRLGTDRDAFRSVDALYTAVSLRDAALVERCADRLKGLGEDGRLPAPAAASLATIVEEARASRWESAQDRLSRFIEGQRR